MCDLIADSTIICFLPLNTTNLPLISLILRACPPGQLTTKVYDYRKQIYPRRRALSFIQEISFVEIAGSGFPVWELAAAFWLSPSS